MNTTATKLSLRDLKVIALSLLGGAIEVFDFIIFVFLATTIADVFFPASTPEWIRLLESVTLFSVGYLARPLGGLLIAHYSDRYGRKKMFTQTLLFMALPSLLMGILPGYNTLGYWAPLLLLLARLIQGAALGGEVPNAWVFVAEHTPKQHRGLALGLLQAGLTLGYMLAALTITLLTQHLTPQQIHEWAWRIPFMTGGLLGFIAIWLRRWLQETPVFTALLKNRQISQQLPLKTILQQHKRPAIQAFLLTLILSSAVIITVVVLPIILQKFRHLSAATAFEISCTGILALNAGCIIAGWMADRIGAQRTIVIYSILLALSVSLVITHIDQGTGVIAGGYIVLGLSCGAVAAVPAVIVQLFPAQVKVTGISLIYNMAYSICSGVLPLLLLWLYQYSALSLISFGWVVALLAIITWPLYRRFPRHI